MVELTRTMLIYAVVSIVILFVLALNLFFMYRMKKKLMFKDLPKQKIKEIKVKANKKVEKDFEPYSPMKSKSKFSIAYWREYFLDKYSAGSIVLINMELTNGFHRLMLVKEKDEGFVFKGKKYLFDDEHKYYNIDAKLYMFDYHESIDLPIRRKIPVTSIKKHLESTADIDIEYAINPSTLQRFMTAKIAEGVMKGTQLDEFFRKINMFIIVIMVAVLVHLALFLYASGILQNVKLPF